MAASTSLLPHLPTEEWMELDLMNRSIGEMGKWQVIMFLNVCLLKLSVACHLLAIIFQAAELDSICLNDDTLGACDSNCTVPFFYNSDYEDGNILTEWNLVCDRAYLKSVVQMVTMSGLVTGSLIFGYLSDKYGRVHPLVFSGLLLATSGCICGVVKNFYVFLVMKLISNTAVGGILIMTFVYLAEISGITWRTTFTILYQVPFALGYILLPVVGYYFRNWRHLQLIISGFNFIYIFFIFMPESPIWLITAGRDQDAIKMLTRAAKFNNRPTDKIPEYVADYVKLHRAGRLILRHPNTFEQLIDRPIMRIFLIVSCLNWFGFGFSFYGICQFIGQIAQNKYFDVAFTGVAQLPPIFMSIYTLERFGRRTNSVFCNAVSGVFILAMHFVPKDVKYINEVCIFFVMYGLFGNITVLYIYTIELFPTPLRNLAMGFCSMICRVGALLAPLVLGFNMHLVSVLLFGIIPIVAAVGVFFLPETKGVPLPDTIEEAEMPYRR